MTCIVALKDGGKVYVGGDAAGTSDASITARRDPKVFKKNGMLFGFTDSFRAGQIIHHSLKIPPKPKSLPTYKYMCTTFIEGLVECFTENKCISYKDSKVEMPANFIIAYEAEIYTVYCDFQIAINIVPYAAIGSGEDFALGALHAMGPYQIDPRVKVKAALDAASEFSTHVCKPYTILSI